jgi:short-subunit dehydrogenase
VNSGVGGETSFYKWNWNHVNEMIDTNFRGAIHTVEASLRVMALQNHGCIVGISSVAAMRGLPQRTIYGSTKLAFANYLEGVAIEHPDLQFTTIYPGFIDTPLNQGQPNRFWLMTPEIGAKKIIRAVAKKKIEYIFPWQMCMIFYFSRITPTFIYRWLSSRGLGKKLLKRG